MSFSLLCFECTVRYFNLEELFKNSDIDVDWRGDDGMYMKNIIILVKSLSMGSAPLFWMNVYVSNAGICTIRLGICVYETWIGNKFGLTLNNDLQDASTKVEDMSRLIVSSNILSIFIMYSGNKRGVDLKESNKIAWLTSYRISHSTVLVI